MHSTAPTTARRTSTWKTHPLPVFSATALTSAAAAEARRPAAPTSRGSATATFNSAPSSRSDACRYRGPRAEFRFPHGKPEIPASREFFVRRLHFPGSPGGKGALLSGLCKESPWSIPASISEWNRVISAAQWCAHPATPSNVTYWVRDALGLSSCDQTSPQVSPSLEGIELRIQTDRRAKA